MSAGLWICAAFVYAALVVVVVRLMRFSPKDNELIIPAQPCQERRKIRRRGES